MPRFLKVISHGSFGAGVAHFFLAVYSSFHGIHLLAVLSLLSVLFFAGCLALLRHGRVNITVLLAWLQIAGYIGFASYELSAYAGFRYYLLVVVPLIFICSPYRLTFNVVLAALMCAEFVALGVLFEQAAHPSATPSVIDRLWQANAVCAFVMSGYLSWVYSRFALRAERGLLMAANTDPLTELSNRRHAMSVIQSEIQRRSRNGHPLTVVLIDIDNFKAINDRYGHEAGDAVITYVGRCLKDSVRGHDLVARWGGEEFLLILPETDLAGALCLTERIRDLLASQGVEHRGQRIIATGTFGISEFHDDDTIDSCLKRADDALYRGKVAGKNRVELGAPDGPALPAT